MKRYEYGIRRQSGSVSAIVRQIDSSGRGVGATKAFIDSTYEHAEAAAHRYIRSMGAEPPASPAFTVSDCGASS